ncbi:hypothetical protein [Pseudoxanthomonas dokdonensis]|uniref:Uncharacterized protein n=1 Tax=Pseudoxanthomonas dokdonensis TaxID=344882 RepID=A0A0R0CQE7_9GAMM|nr:hypothetical protein [Pseudoxanthomonas dokdonensis]KRG72079.1 hypothetical protein ABB29_01080 [Pseudoxanthomonas dokdonensis]
MSRFTDITDRALELASQAGTSIRHAVPDTSKLLQTGAAIGAVRTGGKVATTFVRRNPAVMVAAAAGLGLLAFAAYRKRKRDQANAPLEGSSRRVEARRVRGPTRATAASRRRAAREAVSEE